MSTSFRPERKVLDLSFFRPIFTWLPKRYVVHTSFLLLVLSAGVYSRITTGSNHTSLLHTFFSENQLADASAGNDSTGTGGPNQVEAEEGTDNLTLENAEVSHSTGWNSTAVVAPLGLTGEQPEASATPEPVKTEELYTIADGDTIGGIATKFNVSTNTILWANGLRSTDTIKVGDQLTILPTTGVKHEVKSGDTLLSIAKQYDADALQVKEYNKLADSSKLAVGQKLIIPDGAITPAVLPQIVPKSTQLAVNEPTDDAPAPIVAAGKGFLWPTISQRISQYFKGGHTGIDIPNKSRPPIRAALSGKVAFAGWKGGYGNLVILDHGNGVQTYYAHQEKFYVSQGDAVTKGEAVGKMGSTGRSTGAHVHFEVRKNGQPVDPMGYF